MLSSTNLTITTQTRLANVITAIAQNELLSESCRIKLAELSMFQIDVAFQRLDQARIGALAHSDILDFLSDNRISHSQFEAAYLFKRLDADRDGRVSIKEYYLTELLVSPNLAQAVIARQPYSIDVGMLLPQQVEAALADLFAQEIANYRTINPIRQLLVGSLDYTTFEAFRTLDLFNQGYVSRATLVEFMRPTPLTENELNAFFTAVDLDRDGKISYSELMEAVHLMEPLPYRRESQTLRQSELLAAIENNRSLERLSLQSYPYYFYPYYPYYYPYYYPTLKLENLRQRENSLDRLRRSRLQQIESENRIRDIENEHRRSAERQRSAERLRQIHEESRLRQLQIEEQGRLRELDIIRDEELRRSRERVRLIENEARLQQLEAETRARDIERESRLLAWEREKAIQQAEIEREIAQSEIKLKQIERQSSLERLQQLESLRRAELDKLRTSTTLAYTPYYSTYYSNIPYYDRVLSKYPYSIVDSVNAFNTIRRYSPEKSLIQSQIYESPSKLRKQEFRLK